MSHRSTFSILSGSWRARIGEQSLGGHHKQKLKVVRYFEFPTIDLEKQQKFR
jgi:hypothetical protein